MRLLSFLNDIERTLQADDPEPEGGVWQISRMINPHNGLARLVLASGPAGQATPPRGSILVQAFTLADGSFCLKASLYWRGSEACTTKAVYTRPGLNWRLAAAEVAALWAAGAPAASAQSMPEASPAMAAAM